MTDTTTRKPLTVSSDGITPAFLNLPFSQLAAVRALLDGAGVSYWVDEDIISFDDEPEVCWIYFRRGVDPQAVQKLLDSQC